MPTIMLHNTTNKGFSPIWGFGILPYLIPYIYNIPIGPKRDCLFSEIRSPGI